MNFAKPIAGKIARDETTTAIRPPTSLKPGDRRCVKAAPEPGKKKNTDIQCHIEILDVEDMRAGDVTFKDARACGHRTTDDFKAAWVAMHDKAFMLTLLDMDPDVAREAAIARFNRRHAGRPAQRLTFKRAVDIPRFLADQRVSHGKHDDGQYTASPARAIDDLEVVDEMTQKRYAERAAKEGELQRASCKSDLEAERARRKAERGRSMRLPPYARRAA